MEELKSDIEKLRVLCPSVDLYMSNAEYIAKYGPDGYTDENILSDCYDLVSDELEALGILLPRDMFNDFHSLNYLYYYRKWFDGNNLRSYLKTNKDQITPLRLLLENNEDLSDLLNDLVAYWYDINPNNYLVGNMYELWLEVSSDTRLHDHMEAILLPLDDSPIVTAEMEIGYVAFVEEGRKRARHAAELIVANLDTMRPEPNRSEYLHKRHLDAHSVLKYISSDLLDLRALEHALKYYDATKILPANIAKYALLDKEYVGTDAIHPCMEAESHALEQEHALNNPHHLEYWNDVFKERDLNTDKLTPPGIIPLHHAITIAAHYYDPDMELNVLMDKISSDADRMEYIPDDSKIIVRQLCMAFA